MSFNTFRKGILPFAASTVLALSATAVIAAEDGTPGMAPDGSTGTLNVNVDIPKLVRITDLQDIEFDDESVGAAVFAESGLVGNSDACVRANAEFDYTITASSDNAEGNTFRMTDGSAHIPYTVQWGATPLDSGVDLTGQLVDLPNLGTGPACPTGGDKITVAVSFAALTADGIEPGSYTDILTLNVVPE